MGLKACAEAFKHGGQFGRDDANVQGQAEEKGGKGSVLCGRGGSCCGGEQKEGQDEKGIKWLCPVWER